VRSPYLTLDKTPVQSSLVPLASGTIELDPGLADALHDLDGFDYAWLLTWLGPRDGSSPPEVAMRLVPFFLKRQPREVGYLATRSPRRLNPIGLSLIRIVAVDPPNVNFAGVDVVDGTPVLDLKPYVTRFDRPRAEPRCGWFDSVALEDGATPETLRPPGE